MGTRDEAKQKKDDLGRLENNMPVVPDPFWPEGVVPGHLPSSKRSDPAVVAEFTGLIGEIWHCEKCGRVDQKSLRDDRYCHECFDKETQNRALAKKINANWMEQSAELGLAVYERQPEETNMEWLIWTRYRDHYPMKIPTWTELATECSCSVATVLQAANKWSYKVRLVAWARATDDLLQEDRVAAIKQMNEKQLSMAQRIQEKLSKAIDTIQPELLKPNEIVNLFKVATELERKVTMAQPEKVESTTVDTKTKQIVTTKAEDLGEVLEILKKANLWEGKTVGVEQTTRILVKGDEMNEEV